MDIWIRDVGSQQTTSTSFASNITCSCCAVCFRQETNPYCVLSYEDALTKAKFGSLETSIGRQIFLEAEFLVRMNGSRLLKRVVLEALADGMGETEV